MAITGTDKERKKMAMFVVCIVVTVLVIVGIIGGIVIFYRTPAMIRGLSYNIIVENGKTYIEFTVKTIGGSLLFGAAPSYMYHAYFSDGICAGGNDWDKSSSRKYVKRIGPFENGTVVWFVVVVNGGKERFQYDHATLAIDGLPPSSNDKNLTIKNVTCTKLNGKVLISVEVYGTTNVHTKYVYFNGGSSGGSRPMFKDNGTYTAKIDLNEMELYGRDQKEGILLFRVIAFDDYRRINSAVYPVDIQIGD
jgi:hypothetical protein